MSNTFKASRDIIVRTEKWSEALEFYGSVLGFPITERSETIVGFETGAFCLYVERGKEHGPVFDFLVPDIQEAKRQLVAAGCTEAVAVCETLEGQGLISTHANVPYECFSPRAWKLFNIRINRSPISFIDSYSN